MKVALALGGGASRGLAHLGVIRVLEEAGFPIDMIVGTSMGALVGAAYAATPNTLKVQNDLDAFFRSAEFRQSKLAFLRQRKEAGGIAEGEAGTFFANVAESLRRGWVLTAGLRRQSVISSDEVLGPFRNLLPDRNIEDLPVPFASVALDLAAGTPVIINRGSLRDAVMASAAIPGIFPPLKRNGQLLVDGAWADPVPVVSARTLGADFIIAVDVVNELNDTGGLERGYGVLSRAFAVALFRFKQELLRTADLVIRPAVSQTHWADFSHFNDLAREGELAMRAAMPALRRRYRWRRLWHRWVPVQYRYPLPQRWELPVNQIQEMKKEQ